MLETLLHSAVDQLAQLAQRIADPDLDRDWAWGAYDEQGVRFAFFRTYEELRELAALTATARQAEGRGATTAQRILAQYHAAFLDLEAALLGLDDEAGNQAPAEGEWSVRETVAHIAGADAGFYGAVTFALARARGGLPAAEIPDEAWDDLLGHDEEAFTAVMDAPLRSIPQVLGTPPPSALRKSPLGRAVASIRDYHAAIHRRVLDEFAGITEEELSTPSMYWEGYALGLRFRLHRFDSHLRQHTVQVDKMLEAIGRGPNEAARLLRLIYAALAEAEGVCIGAWDVGAERRREVATEIEARSGEMAGTLG